MEHNLTTGSVPKTILLFSLPYFLSYFLQTLYGTADLFIIGQFNGVGATTAVSIGSQVMHMLTVMIVGLAMGTTVMIGRAVGANDREQVNRSIGNTVTLFMLLSICLTVVLLYFVKPIVAIMSTPQEAVKDTIIYLTICFIGIPFITAYNMISSIFRGMGDSKSPMYFIAIACAFNIALDYLFIGALHMGPAGAALGTTLSQTISVLVSLTMVFRKKMIPGFQPVNLRPVRAVMGNLLKIGFPIAMQDGFIQIAFIVITIIANRRGLNDAAAVGIVEKMISLFFLVPSSMLSTVSALSAQNIGAGKHERASQTLLCAMSITVFYGIVISVVSAQLYLGHHFCRDPLLFQRIFLCVWSFRYFLYAQSGCHYLRTHSDRLSGIQTIPGHAVPDGICRTSRFISVCDHLHRRVYVDEAWETRRKTLHNFPTDQS